MDNDPKHDDEALAALFDAVKVNAPETTPDFMARLMQDAEDAMPQAAAPAPASPEPSLLAGLKGLFAASGLTGAAALGVWIGFVMPETLNTLADGLANDQTVSLSSFLPGADLLALSE